MTTVPAERPRLVPALLLAAVVFGALDAFWLTVGSGALYDEQIGHLLAESPDAGAAVAFYVVYLLGFTHFVLRPALEARSRTRGLRDAAAFGLVTYATFDLTAMAVFRDVPLVVVLVDLAWGTVLCTVTAAVVLGVLLRRGPAPDPTRQRFFGGSGKNIDVRSMYSG
ncbi:DUF2177 family protein [Phycicoccus sonneratiae]|uniref:DUF2177 family protein n=1 Tax=Phycicoccus sonneratiae TaxID=2807628 RepID=A0ABS2CR81_9MICO|nr:DUF2177 family protein [Phycicoccus sonneraticus]MBM6402345.1 DUF2177 family protein [Phycicoccus sonneraticus]